MFAQQPAHYGPLLPGVWKGLIKFLSKAQHSGGGSRGEGSREFTFLSPWRHLPGAWLPDRGGDWWEWQGTDLIVNRTPTHMSALGWESCFFFSFIKNCQCSPEISFPFSRLPKDSVVLAAPSSASSIFSPYPHCAVSQLTSRPALLSPAGDLYPPPEHFPS